MRYVMHIDIHVRGNKIQGGRFTLSLCLPNSLFLFASLTSHAPATDAMSKLIESPGLDSFMSSFFLIY